ncbi:hypothetical protein ACFXKR_11935 [Streptomyces violascens]|uniref:hypothetical protein n=1 Tax=Streptomyces violascens TaxID=67381 RepID=UPI0036776746
MPLIAAELTPLGAQLYGLLSEFVGYQAAIVGLAPEGFIDPAELRYETGEYLAAGTPSGPVLVASLHSQLITTSFEPSSRDSYGSRIQASDRPR